MQKRVVVENSLEDLKEYLGDRGYDVRTMNMDSTLMFIDKDKYDAIIVSDKDNLRLSEGITSDKKIIEAGTLTPEQVIRKLNEMS
jgi:hypothetical protein